MKPRFIIVSGLIGVGKTHFTRQLAGILDYAPIYEPVESNPYLADFYQDAHRWAYPMQERLKHMRFRLHQDAMWGIRSGRYPGVVFDRSIWEDTVFAEINRDLGTIDPRNFETYLMGFQDLVQFLREPDVIVFLKATPEECKRRADARDRPAERSTSLGEGAGIPIDYMQRLHDGYMRWIEVMSARMPIVQIDWQTFGSVADAWQEIQRHLTERTRFTRSLGLP